MSVTDINEVHYPVKPILCLSCFLAWALSYKNRKLLACKLT